MRYTDPALHHMALQGGYSHTVHSSSLTRDRPLLLALWALGVDRLIVAVYILIRCSTTQIIRRLERKLLLLDTVEHTLIEPCTSTLLDRDASEGL